MQYFLKTLKYNLIKHKLRKNNVFTFNEQNNSISTIYLFFVACGTNMGDHAIVRAEKNYIYDILGNDTNIVEVLVSTTENAIFTLNSKIKENDIIIFSGGGYLGDEYIEAYLPMKQILKKFYKNNIIIFPQTIFFKNKIREREFIKLCKKCKSIKIFVRERQSSDIFKNHGISTFLVPDIVLSCKVQTHKKSGPILLCMRDDVEKYISDNVVSSMMNILSKYNENIIKTDTVLPDLFDLSLRNEKLDEIFDFFSNSALVITDRIHGMIFSYLTQTPCIALSNYNHKVKSEYNWIKDCNYIHFIDEYNPHEFQKIIDKFKALESLRTIELNSKFSPLRTELKKAYGIKSL